MNLERRMARLERENRIHRGLWGAAVVIGVALVVLFSSEAISAAEPISTDDFLAFCDDRQGSGGTVCASYFLAFIDALIVVELASLNAHICLNRKNVDGHQAEEILRRWSDQKEGARSAPVRGELYVALARAFPCRLR